MPPLSLEARAGEWAVPDLAGLGRAGEATAEARRLFPGGETEALRRLREVPLLFLLRNRSEA